MKAILVIDEMPKTCGDCTFSRGDEDDFESTWVRCYAYNPTTVMHESADMFKKPSWCPLKPLPQKMEEDTIESMMDDYSIGWNDCIEEIEK